jgi:cyclophilin family peptidyl-prolyl cis-trans isomerase
LFEQPAPLLAGRLVFALTKSAGLAKTVTNFLSLCTGEKGMCKGARNKKLHYLDVPVHRVMQGFVAQGGDVTRGDGSGGEVCLKMLPKELFFARISYQRPQSIYGGKFNDEKEGLKVPITKGTLAMANSGKNTNSSQFFVVLTDDTAKLAKLTGKYVAFGNLVEGWDTLGRLDEVGNEDGKPTKPVWIGG